MSNSYFSSNWSEQVTLPVRRVGKHWEFFYGGDIPVDEGCVAELTIDALSITNPSFLERVSQKLDVNILPVGATLLVALNDQSRNGARIGQWPDASREDIPNGTTRFEEVRIGPPKKSRQWDQLEGLWLRLKGLERTEIRTSTILMSQGFPTPTATSLNHAFTLLSKEYETHRISNTGNVYKQFFYQEKTGKWYPLGDLRGGVQVKGEQALMTSAWEEVERTLGWRPINRQRNKR